MKTFKELLENTTELDEALPANFDSTSKAHQHVRSATKKWKQGAKAEYHKDGSATIHTKAINGGISSTTVVDALHKSAGLEHNRSEEDYKNNSEKDKAGLTHTTKQVDKNSHTIHIKESVKLDEELDEANMSSDRSKRMFKSNELRHELGHEDKPMRSSAPAEPHSVHINGKKWKTFADKNHATNVANKIKGATVVKESEELDEASDFHAQAMEHKKQSDAAMDKNDMEAYHHHMSAHHESLGQWHESKGRSSSADKEYEKAEKHHELSLKKSNQKNEGTEMLSFKYFQEVLEEAKKKCKESASELENSHDMKDIEDELDDEEKEELEEAINEVLSKDASAGEWISDFVHSDNPKFAGKSKEKRKQMALAAYYAAQRNEDVEEIEEASYSTKAARAGKDIGKPGKMFAKIAAKAEKAGARSGEAVAGAVLKKLRAKNEEVEIDEQAPVAPVPGMKSGKYAIMVHPKSKQRVTIERKNKGNYPEAEGWKEVGLGVKLKEEVEELDEAAITHIVAKKDLASHKEWMDSEGFDTKTKSLPKSHPKHATHVGIVSKDSKESSYHEDGHAISESVELDEGDELNMRHKFVFNKTAAGKAREVARNREELKMQMKKTKEMGGITGPKGKLPEEVEEIEEISTATMGHAGKTTLKHIKNPGVQLRMAAHDVKPGIKGYRDRVALLKAADAEKKLKESVDEAASPFDWKAYSKERGTAAGEKTKTFHNVKKTSTGTVYTKQVNPDGTSKGSGDDAAKAAEKEQAPKRGRGRPAGVGAKTGSYKPRDPASKAASAAKAAASKAANRAMRKESFDEEFMSSLIEGFEDEDFDDFLQCEEFSELDEATQDALHDFINEKCMSKMKESLTGKQHKLDKNKNGKLDSQDFKLLRKEETEQIQESVTSYAAFLNKK